MLLTMTKKPNDEKETEDEKENHADVAHVVFEDLGCFLNLFRRVDT